MRTTLMPSLLAASLVWPAFASAQPAREKADPHEHTARRVTVHQQREASRDRRSQRRIEQRETIDRTVRIGGNGELLVENLSGDITVQRGDGNQAVIQALKTARAGSEAEAREMLERVRVEFIERGGRAEVKTVYPRMDDGKRNVDVSVSYTITAPAGTRLAVKTLSGDVTVTGITGEVSAQSLSGDIKIANAGRVTAAKTASGDVEITDTTSESAFEANTFSGDVVLRRVKAPRATAGSLSGDVVVDQVDIPRIEVQSLSGNVQFSAPLASRGRYSLTSHSGNVRLEVTGGDGFEIEANTFNGSIRADAALGLKREGDGHERRRERALRGVVGDGSAFVTLRTFSGNVIISRK